MKTSELERVNALTRTIFAMMEREKHPEALFPAAIGNMVQTNTTDMIRSLIVTDAKEQKIAALSELAGIGVEFDSSDEPRFVG